MKYSVFLKKKLKSTDVINNLNGNLLLVNKMHKIIMYVNLYANKRHQQVNFQVCDKKGVCRNRCVKLKMIFSVDNCTPARQKLTFWNIVYPSQCGCCCWHWKNCQAKWMVALLVSLAVTKWHIHTQNRLFIILFYYYYIYLLYLFYLFLYYIYLL